MISIDSLSKTGAFVSNVPVKRTITYKLDDGVETTGDIHVKRLSVGDHESLFMAPDEKSRTAKVISKVIFLGEKGDERMTFEQAYSLHPNLATAMINEFNIVNGGNVKN